MKFSAVNAPEGVVTWGQPKVWTYYSQMLRLNCTQVIVTRTFGALNLEAPDWCLCLGIDLLKSVSQIWSRRVLWKVHFGSLFSVFSIKLPTLSQKSLSAAGAPGLCSCAVLFGVSGFSEACPAKHTSSFWNLSSILPDAIEHGNLTTDVFCNSWLTTQFNCFPNFVQASPQNTWLVSENYFSLRYFCTECFCATGSNLNVLGGNCFSWR